MLIVRVLTAAVKPALFGSALVAGTGGIYIAADGWPGRGDAPSAFRQIQDDGQRLLINEFGVKQDTIVAIDPGDATHRTTVAHIDHADGYGVFATLSPDGRAIAYTGLPAALRKPAPDAPAQAAIVDVDGNVTVLADDVDLLIPPVWSPDSHAVVVRKNTPAEDAAGSFELLLLGRDGPRTSITQWQTAALFPIAFSPDGARLFFATLNAHGSDLYEVAPDGADETLVAHLSDEIARDWRLSPDGATLAYSVAEGGQTPRVVTMTLDIASGAVAEAAGGDGPRAEFNPSWRPDGTLTMAAVAAEGGASAVAITGAGEREQLSENAAGIDLPLGWSPDGETLAVRAVDGKSAFEAGESHVELLRRDGERERISAGADVLIVGWLE